MILLIPGLWNSGPEHWQSYWERANKGVRVVQREWETPRREDWVQTLEAEVAAQTAPVVLAAHSLGCTLVGHWAASTSQRAKIKGALLVAPSDAEGPNYPVGPSGFTPMPLAKLPFPSIVVASTNDEYVSLARARFFAEKWGSRFVDIGARGHINSDSRMGMWPAGLDLIASL
jgi:predicted alpha/beta hydrolase family esterase